MIRMPEAQPFVALVDDQRDLRATLGRELTQLGYRCHPFSSGSDLIEALSYLDLDCILLDLHRSGFDGLATLRAIPQDKKRIPVIFFASQDDRPVAVEAINAGAAHFIEKPATFEQITNTLTTALGARQSMLEVSHPMRAAQQMLSRLTKREREVMQLACDGLQSSEIAQQLKLSVRTIESHRYNAIQKLGDSKLINILKMFQAAEG